MDATTVLAIVCSAVVFCGWLVLPHSSAPTVKAVSREPEREPEREPVAISA
jgi:hypothetical protein